MRTLPKSTPKRDSNELRVDGSSGWPPEPRTLRTLGGTPLAALGPSALRCMPPSSSQSHPSLPAQSHARRRVLREPDAVTRGKVVDSAKVFMAWLQSSRVNRVEAIGRLRRFAGEALLAFQDVV